MTLFERVYVDYRAEGSKLANRLKALYSPSQIEIVDQRPWMDGQLSAREFDRSKRNLFVTNFEGAFFKRCPGSKPGLVCCNYFVLNLGLQCDMNCSYCYLQSFINSPILTIYANIETALQELESLRGHLGNENIRIGTGEVIDSLSLDPLTLYSHDLIDFFRKVPRWTLEFKTKSAAVDQFLAIPHAKNVVVSWSLNPQNVIAKEEHGTASLYHRLAAARRCLDAGFQIAFHLDPLIWHDDWKQSYSELVEAIVTHFDAREINVISLGTLRFKRDQQSMMRERFGMKSLVTQAEMLPGQDGKLRYPQELRTQMLDFVLKAFKSNSPKWRAFLCMETPESWLQTFSAFPQRLPELQPLFDQKAPHILRMQSDPKATLTP